MQLETSSADNSQHWRRLLTLAAAVANPPPLRNAAQWADQERREPPESPRPGKWDSSYTPYFVPILEAASDPRTRQITAVTASQLGKTASLLSIIGHRMCDGPRAPALFVLPTQSMARSMSMDRLARLIRECPALDRIHHKGHADSIYSKTFASVPVNMAWAGSATELASRPVSLLLVDEYSRMTRDVAGEGDPLSLARARTRNYAAPLIVVTSSPTIEDADPTVQQWELGSMEVAEWSCPHCSTWHRPIGKYLSWPEGASSAVAERESTYACPSCGTVIGEEARRAMIASMRYWPYWKDNDGEYHARDDGQVQDYGHRSFWISGFFSPWSTFGSIARDLCAAYRTREPETIQAALNTGLGELWRVRGDAPDWHEVWAHRVPYGKQIPNGVQVITLGADVQQDRIYYVLRGWGAEAGPMESWLIEHGEIHGRTDLDDVWVSFGQLLRRAGLQPRRALIDSGYKPGSDWYKRPDHAVYAFCRREQGLAFPSKGFDMREKPVDSSLIDVNLGGVTIKNGVRLFRVNASHFKEWVYSRIRLSETEPDLWHLPSDVTEEYCRQVIAEELVTTAAGRMQWIARRTKPNHYLDCEVLATAAAYALNLYTLAPRAPDQAPVEAAAPARAPASRFTRNAL